LPKNDARAIGDREMKRAIVFLAVALLIPTSVAVAKGPGTGKSAPKVQYVLKGLLSAYTPFNKATNTNGTITILVKHSNFHGAALKTKSLTFTLTASSKVTFMLGSHAHGQIVDGTKGYITVRAPKKITGDLVTQLPLLATRIHVVVLKAPTP
jgi:hypothetical protein